MQSGEPSRTARAAAFHRAAHQVLEGGRIFADPLAIFLTLLLRFPRGADTSCARRRSEDALSCQKCSPIMAVIARGLT
jgi:hypothetical protein